MSPSLPQRVQWLHSPAEARGDGELVSVEAHAPGVVGRGGRPVGEQADDADFSCEYVDGAKDIAIAAKRAQCTLVVERVTSQ